MAITFRELSMIAELHYGKLPDALKARAAEFFDTLDQDGDGAVTLQELLNSNLEGKFGQEFIQHVFYNLDEEGKGQLEFRECLTLYYLCMYSARVCAACGRNIPHGLGYTCLKCLKEEQPPNNEFSVCLECFSSHNYQHEHGPHHLLHDFVLFDNLLHSRPSSPTASPVAPVRSVEQTMKQCVVCGDYHESAIRGFMCDVHMSRMRSSSEFVCEWCFSYLCSKCGNLFRDSTTRAEPGKWLQRFICPSCHERNITSDRYDASLRRLQEVLSGAELLRQCKTCEIKQRNRTLFWVVNGTNTAPPAAQSQQRATAASARSRSSSFDHQPQVHPTYGGSGGSDGSFRGGTGRNDSSFRGGSGDGSSHGGSSRGGRGDGSSHGGSSRGSRGGPVNRINTPEARSGAAPFNRPNMNDTAAAAVRTVNRMVNAAGRAANMFNAGGAGRGGGGAANMFNAGGGAGDYSGGGGGGGIGMGSDGGSGGNDIGGDGGNGGSGLLGSFMGGGGDGGGDAGNSGFDTSGLLASLGSLMGGGGDGGGDAGNASIDASGLLASIGSLVGGINTETS